MNKLKSVKDIDLAGRKVLLRLDLNAPLKGWRSGKRCSPPSSIAYDPIRA